MRNGGSKLVEISASYVKKLTPKQEMFIREYLVDLNATQAAIRAGYSKRTAGRTGFENLKKPDIQERIQKQVEERIKNTELTAERVLAEIQKLAFSNMLDYVTVQVDGSAYVNLSGLTRDQAAAITEIQTDEYVKAGGGDDVKDVRRVKIKLVDKKGSLEQLGRYFKLFVDRREHSGPGGGPIQHQECSDLSDEQLEKIARGGDDG